MSSTSKANPATNVEHDEDAQVEIDPNNPSMGAYKESYAGFKDAINKNADAIDPEEAEKTGMNLRGKTVVITGAGSGFGAAFAEKAAGFGARVFISDVNVAGVQAVARKIQINGGTVTAYSKPCDTSSWEAQIDMFDAAVKEYEVIDVVVPNAGVGEVGLFFKDKLDTSGKLKKPNLTTINVNLIGAIYTARIGFYHLERNRANKHKAIVFLGSMASQNGLPKGPMYGSAKHGILGFFRSTWFDCKSVGINANIICPWFVDTGIIAATTRAGLFGLPLGSIDHVIAAMIKSASDPEFTGYQVSIDAEGILGIPFEATSIGPTGYYAEFGKRAQSSITLERKIKDLGLIAQATMKYWTPKSILLRLGGFAALIALVYRRIKLGSAP